MGASTSTARELNAQACIYEFLARVFSSNPTEESIQCLPEMADEMGVSCPSGFSASELDQEFMDLLVIPGPRYVAPYESVFRDEWLLPTVLKRGSNPGETGETIKGLLMGRSTFEVRQSYLDAGLLPEEELPDHISNELRFLAYLCKKESEAPGYEARALAEVRERFRRDHVVKWIGDLRKKVEDRELLGYYGAAARVAEALLREDDDPVVEPVRPIAFAAGPQQGCPFHHG